MSQYARIDNGIVAELFTPPVGATIQQCFHSDLVWVACDGVTGIAVGWSAVFSNGVWSFSAAPNPAMSVQQAVLALGNLLTAQQQTGVYFTPTGGSSPILFSTDSAAQTIYTAEWNMINASPVLRADGDPIIAADGTPVALSNADAKALVEKALAYVKGCVANYTTLHAQVLLNPTTDTSGGWPSNS